MTELASKGQLRWSFIRMVIIFVPLVITLGLMSSRFAGPTDSYWFLSLEKPALYPPGWMFGLVWTILYGLMGWALAIVWHAFGHAQRGAAIGMFIVQLLLNLAWTPLFFKYHQLMGSWILMALLIAAVIGTTVLFYKVRKAAGWLMAPYILWLAVAFYLNISIWQLNPDGGQLAPPAQDDGVVDMQMGN